MKKRIFRRIFLYYALILVFSGIFVEFYVTRVVRENSIKTIRNNLSIHARLIAPRVPFGSSQNMDAFCSQLKKEVQARVTVISPEGVVLGDSDRDSALMDNHLSRPEIQQSLVNDTGWSIRRSNTLKEDLLYTAINVITNGSTKGFVRLAVPLTEIDRSITMIRIEIIIAVILIIIATELIMIAQTGRLRRFVRQIIDFSRSLANGSLDERLRLEGAAEFEEIAENLNTMSIQLKKNIDQRDEEANRLNVILKSVPDALLIISNTGVIELANDSAKEFFADGQMQGKAFSEVVRSPEFFSLIDEVRNRHISGIAEMRIDYPMERYCTVRVSPLFYKIGELSGFVVIFHDTTHMKKLEQQRKDFVANVSHEIKTPVTAIKGFAETLLDGALKDREHAVNFLHTIKTHSERLNRLVEDLLTISRIELGVIKIEKTDAKIAEIFDYVIETLQNKADEKGLFLRKALKDDDAIIIADRDRVIQILLNLVDNAIKFTKSGGVEIGFSQQKETHYLFVKDTGIGISSKYIPRLGERFFRVDPSRSRELGGTGLGLAIVKHQVKAHGWEMKIVSDAGTGTLVKIMVS